MKTLNTYITEKFKISKDINTSSKESKYLIAVPLNAMIYFSAKYKDRYFEMGKLHCFLVSGYDMYMDPHISLKNDTEVRWYKVPEQFSDIDDPSELEKALKQEKYEYLRDLERFYFE